LEGFGVNQGFGEEVLVVLHEVSLVVG
jgi:hypothetical protein